MTDYNCAFVSFELRNGQFIGFIEIDKVLSEKGDPEIVLQKATEKYKSAITEMKALVEDIKNHRANRKLLPARKIWELGNRIFELRSELERLSLQIDGLYDHLVRDLNVKRKWLEKVVIFRRYIPREDLIPESLNWGYFEKGTRRKVEKLLNGLPTE